jgi:hypothetical protein
MEMKTASGNTCSVTFADEDRKQMRCEFIIDISDRIMLFAKHNDALHSKLLEILSGLNTLSFGLLTHRRLVLDIAVEIAKMPPNPSYQTKVLHIDKIIELVKSANLP